MTDQLAADAIDRDTSEPDEDRSGGHTSTVGPGDEVGQRGGAGRSAKAKRVSRWDRPPEARDWRFFVGVVGKILVTTGLLMFGFVGYQLWGTGIETARAQNRLETQFGQLVASTFGGVDDAVVAAERPTLTAQVPFGAGGATEGADPAVSDPPMPPTADPIGDDSTSPVAVDLVDRAVVQDDIPQPVRGDPLLRLEIPKIGRDDIVVPGVTLNDLKNGPGHYPDSPLPGQLGNAAIAGHRTTYGAPFFDVDRLEAGDEIITTLLNGDRFVYEVTHLEVVSASDYHVVATTNPNVAELTLTSCDPKYTARDRIVVHSVLNPDKSSNVGFPTYYALEPAADPEPIPGDDPTLTAEPVVDEPGDLPIDPNDIEVTETESARVELEVASGRATASGATAGDAEPAGPATAASVADRDSVDAFSQGWFDDREAFPQIALWALALAMIATLAYRISRRYRNLAVGMVVGVVPFVVALFFFYQNVNRLLPPGI